MKRKGLVFSLDAAFALLLLGSLSLAVLLFSFANNAPETVHENLHLKAGDSVNVLSHVKVYDVRREAPIAHLFDTGALGESMLNESVMQLIADLWASGDAQNLSRAQNISDYFLSKLYSPYLNFAVFAAGASLSNRTPSGEYSAISASKSFISGISANRSIAKGCVARALIQKIRGKSETALAYFGGFEGEGNMTAIVQGVPASANVTEVSFEANLGAPNVTLFLNGVDCGFLNKTGAVYSVNKWVFNATQGSSCMNAALKGSENKFELNFTFANLTPQYFGGGLVKIIFETDELSSPSGSAMRHYFNGVDGIINYYSSFYVSGNITQMSGRLHLLNNYTTFLVIGNKTVYEDNGTNESRVIDFTNANFTAAFPDYSEISLKTIPLRLGVIANFTGGRGNADVVLITDTSGSMNWRMNQDGVSGTVRTCTDPLLYDPSTQRLSLAKCIDQEFAQIILGLQGNRLALVSFSSSLNNYTEFSSDVAYLNSTIGAYSSNGWTCVACSINKAYELLRDYSNSSRKKYVIVMSDGVANRRAAGGCGFTDLEESGGTDFAGGDQGGFVHLDVSNVSNWTDFYAIAESAIYSVSPENSSYAISSGNSGKFVRWNGSNWTETQDMGNNAIYGIDLLNSTYGFAAGASGKIFRLNGTAWSEITDTGSNTNYGIAVYNSTLAFAVGSGGLIYRWNGASWSQNASLGSYTIYDVKFVNNTWAFAVGSSGKIFRWNGSGWAEYQDTGSQTWRALSIVNSTTAFVAGSGGAIYRRSGGTFSSFASPTSQQINGIVFRSDGTGEIVTSNALAYSYRSGAWALARDARYTGTLVNGIGCSDDDSCSAPFANNYAAQNANYSSCRLFSKIENSTVDAVGFGPVATCAIGNTTLNAIAQCGNGSYFASSNSSQLADFYRNLAQAIVRQSNASQTVSATGDVRSVLYPDSYIDFVFSPQTQMPYQSLSLSKTASLSSCQGAMQIPPNFNAYDFRVTSYSADRWTSNVSIFNSNGWNNVFDLSAFNSTSYKRIGDPFLVQVNPGFLRQGQNTIDVRTAFSPGNQSPDCSTDNTILYKGWINASVGYGAFFPNCSARNVKVYYDLNGDNVQDGYANVSIGGNSSEEYILTEQLNQNQTNAIEDAFLRLLHQLDLNPDGGVPGSQTNPIDVALSQEVSSTSIEAVGLPALNSTAFSVVLWQ